MDALVAAVRAALLRVAENVAKHTVQRSGWHPDDPCFVVDLQAAEEELLGVVQGEVERLQGAIRKHRDQRGDDRCWLDDEELYRTLPEGYTPPDRDCWVELALCERYITSRHNPGTVYVSPQRRIEELEAEVARLREALKQGAHGAG